MKKTIVIAEAGVNHNGDIEIAKKLIEVASEAGADYIKFQTFNASKLVTIDAQKADYQIRNTGLLENQMAMLKRLELSYDHHNELLRHAKNCGIKFLSTAFDMDSLNFLGGLGLDLVKIPSGEITNYPYLCAASKLKKPVVLSTGMSTLGDIEAAIKVLENGGLSKENITLLHCTTEYPAPVRDVNLNVIQTLEHAFGVKVGYSDHTIGIEIPIAAVSLGACLIEKHFTLDRFMDGPDHLASLEPLELKQMIDSIRLVEQALGDGIKRVTEREVSNSRVVRKSIVASRNIKRGEFFTMEMLGVKRPGIGLSPMRLHEVVGKVAKQDFSVDQIIEL